MIRSENKGKIGIYAWVNTLNNKFYIGSGNPLYLRLSDYYQNWYLLSQDNFSIVRALSLYGIVRFYLVILYRFKKYTFLWTEKSWSCEAWI